MAIYNEKHDYFNFDGYDSDENSKPEKTRKKLILAERETCRPVGSLARERSRKTRRNSPIIIKCQSYPAPSPTVEASPKQPNQDNICITGIAPIERNFYGLIVIDMDDTILKCFDEDEESELKTILRPFVGYDIFLKNLGKMFPNGFFLLWSKGNYEHVTFYFRRYFKAFFNAFISGALFNQPGKPVTYARKMCPQKHLLAGPTVIIDDLADNLRKDQYDLVVDMKIFLDTEKKTMNYDDCLKYLKRIYSSWINTIEYENVLK